MNADQYRVVYDIANESMFGMSGFIVVWLIGIVLMIALVSADLWFNKFSLKGYTLRNKLALVFLPIFLLVGVCANLNAVQTQRECLDARANGRYEIIEGTITGLRREGKVQKFKVDNVEIAHSTADGTKCGYKPARGGNLRDGSPVKLFRYRGQTLRFEIVN